VIQHYYLYVSNQYFNTVNFH